MVSFPKYEQYKDSGVEWLGEIPEHWTVERAKWLFNKVNRSTNKLDEVVTAFRDGEVTLRKHRRTERFTNAIQEHGYQGIRKGDLVIHAMDAFAGAIGVSDSDGKSTPVYSVCVPRGEFEVNNYYYAYLLRYVALSGFILSLARGIRERSTDFKYKDLSRLLLPLPSIQEQKRIVEFLDRKTEEIDRAIAHKKRLIELLEEQKTILINQAVTKGLNPNAPMKDSGIEWLGKIPEHWEVKRAKYLLKEVDEHSQTGEEELLSVSHITGVTPRSEKNVNMFMAENYTGSKLCKKNDLVINIMWAWMGALGVSDQVGIISSSYSVFRQHKKDTFNSWFLEYLLRSKEYISQYNRLSTGIRSSRLRLYADVFLKQPILLPSKKEQDQIENEVKEKSKETNKTIDSIEKQIEKLKELKQILIAEAVTGKIKI